MAARRISPLQALVAAGGVLAAGALVAILTTPDPLWWQLHFSHLGTFTAFSGYAFNATVVSASALLVLFAIRLRIEMERHAGTAVLRHRWAATVAPVLVALIGMHLSLVGFFPLNANLFVHERGSSGAVLAFGTLLGTARWMLKGMHRRVARATRRVGLCLTVSGTAFGFGVVNLAGFELVVFSLMFAWLYTLTRSLGEGSDVNAPEPERREEPKAGSAHVVRPHCVTAPTGGSHVALTRSTTALSRTRGASTAPGRPGGPAPHRHPERRRVVNGAPRRFPLDDRSSGVRTVAARPTGLHNGSGGRQRR